MSDAQSTKLPQHSVLAEIALFPIEDEDNDFETLSAVEEVTTNLLNEITSISDYSPTMASSSTRSTGLILIIGEIAHQAIAQKDLIILFLQACIVAIRALAKQDRVKKIEVKLGEDSISIEDTDKVTAQSLLDSFKAKHPGEVLEDKFPSTLHITGKVSKSGKS